MGRKYFAFSRNLQATSYSLPHDRSLFDTESARASADSANFGLDKNLNVNLNNVK